MATILVVDDRPSNREFLALLLGPAGHTLLEAGNGAAALELACRQRPDLVLTNIEWAHALHAEPALVDIPILFYGNPEQLAQLAYHDAQTKLPNRALFLDRVGQLIGGARQDGGLVALLALGMPRLLHINETQGRQIGDLLLSALTERLDDWRPATCSIARIGADRFALAARLAASDAVANLCEALQALLAEPFAVEGHLLRLGARLGVAFYPVDGDDAETVLTHAEAALRQAAQSGASPSYHAAGIGARMAQRRELEASLQQAFAQGQFELHYQPKVDLQTGHISGAEALIRWNHPSKGLLPPCDFLPLAEENGLIAPIGEWVIRSVCAQQAEWAAAKLPIVPLSLNVSALQFKKNRVLDSVQQAIDRYALFPRCLELELTESALLSEADDVADALAILHRIGVRLALDDFGTGYSSLACLKKFPFNVVKIDRAFIADITRDVDDAAIAKSVIAVGHSMNLRVVAEGVESEAQLQYLLRHGCDEIQGYYFSPPVPAAEFEAMLRAGKSLALRPLQAVPEQTLLVVDDDPLVRQELEQLFRREQFRVLTARDAESALELLALQPVQVVLSDQRLPRISGTEFLGMVEQLYPDTIRIILTSYVDLHTVLDALNEGAVYKFLSKPWNEVQLCKQIRDAFRRYRPA